MKIKYYSGFQVISILHEIGGDKMWETIERFAKEPTADVVEVVRCKDCIHCADDWNGNQPMFTCELGMCHESVEPNGYCSYAER